MNERILKLFTQACYHGDYEPENVPNEVVEKFAELIVKECCEVIDAAKPSVVQVPAEVALDMTAKNVKAYFGVE